MNNPDPPRRYRWPLFVAAGIVLGIVLAYVWVKREVDRTRLRTAPFPPTSTDTPRQQGWDTNAH